MSEPINLYCGQDPREQIGLSVFCSSVWRRASVPVSITPISHKALSDGTNEFTLSRFLVPFISSYKGWAIWADGSDMLCLADIAELWALRDWKFAVQVVKHKYETRHPVKYLDQPNPNYERKNWSSLMLINCAHYRFREIRPDTIQRYSGTNLHRFEFLGNDAFIGGLDPAWNYIADEPNQHGPAKIAHYSIGLPVWYPETEYAAEWRYEFGAMNHYQEWRR